MKAQDYTSFMLKWWLNAGIHRADLAVKQVKGTMIRHLDLSLEQLPLGWARAENAKQSEIYIRPARGHSWPLVFLDDVNSCLAKRIPLKYASLVIQTSQTGGCHVWLLCSQNMDESQRCQAQRWLAIRAAADPASISGEHLGRLAGTKNWKRKGVWVNVIAWSNPDHKSSWNPNQALQQTPQLSRTISRNQQSAQGIDQSASGKEWGWLCGALQAGVNPNELYERLVEHARPRRGMDAARYARYTLEKAIRKTK